MDMKNNKETSGSNAGGFLDAKNVSDLSCMSKCLLILFI